MPDFHYDHQIKRYLYQVIRVFSHFQWKTGKNEQGFEVYKTVPARMAPTSRQAEQALTQNSENRLNVAPLITVNITGMTYDRARIQDPGHVSKVNIRERDIDPTTGERTTTQGNSYTVERMMPAPYTMNVSVDIWTTNQDQKCQLFEQIVNVFNPSFEIQSTDNYIDWTSLTRMELMNFTWSSRSVPIGTDDPIDIMTFEFEVPVWISPPVRISRLGVIEKIIASIYDDAGVINQDVISGNLLSRTRVTPTGLGLLLLDGRAKLLGPSESVTEPNTSLDVADKYGEDIKWMVFIDTVGKLINGSSYIELELANGNLVVGKVSYDPLSSFELLFNVDTDTIPTNTLNPVNAVINPISKGPGSGLPSAASGQRYLLVDDIGDADNDDPSSAWGSLVAKANDVIQFNGTNWVVSFDSSSNQTLQYLVNSLTNIQYKWDGESWTKSYQGVYAPGFWTLVL